jgi:outer membrane protein assembly factor BamB
MMILPLCAAEGQSANELAKKILDATGVKGGLIVHVGCGDGKLTTALHASGSYLVQGLDTNSKNVQKAREHIESLGLYGTVSADRFDGQRLPYIDSLVNLVVVEDPGDIPRAEVMRVLAPKGVAYVRRVNAWRKTVKPRPEEMDDWTHYLHDASNNAVSHDVTIGPPRHLQWVGSPRYSRHHDHMSGASAMVSADGRLYYVFDHGNPLSVQLPSKWRLVARDAFNGTVLWKRPIETWHTQMFRLKSGPAQLTRRLVATGDRVYVTLGLEAPVTVLDGATGTTLRTYAGTEKAEEIIYDDGTLFVLVNDRPFRQPALPSELNYDFAEGPRRVLATDAASGKTMWEVSLENVLPLTLTADDKRVLFCDGERIVCFDRDKGGRLWQSEQVSRRKVISTYFAPTVVAYRDVVLFSGGSVEPDERNRGGGDNTMYAFSVETGRTLWKAEHPASGYKSPEDILVVGNLVWTPETIVGSSSGVMIGRDPATGEVRKQFLPDVETHWFHHRCYRAKATDEYILTSRTGIEFVDPDTEHWQCHHWVRGACLYGIMPANGMIYNPPHPCACYLEAKLYGFNALPWPELPQAAESPGRYRRKAALNEVRRTGRWRPKRNRQKIGQLIDMTQLGVDIRKRRCR